MRLAIGLVDPGSKKTLLNETLPHLGLAYIAAVLEGSGYEVQVLDQGAASAGETERFLQQRFSLWGISATSFTFEQALRAAAAIKSVESQRLVVVGGPHVSIAMEEILLNPLIDYAVYGEGEFALLELVEILECSPRPVPSELATIRGLIFRANGRITVNPPRPRLTSIDQLPFPAFHLFDMSQHDNYPLSTSRGCPYGCSFCAIKAIWGTSWTPRSPENLVQEIEHAYTKYHLDQKIINLIDDSFNVDPNRALRFCELVIEHDLRIRWFPWGIRADRMTLPLARKMKQAGCIGASVGVESADDGVLRAMGKKETLEEITRGISWLSMAGLPLSATFMIGNIGDTLATVQKTLAFAREQRFESLFFYLALPYPKTELHEHVKQHGSFLHTDYTRFHHFSSQPVFETPEFTAPERAYAFQLSRRLVSRMRLRAEVKRKVARLLRGDLKGLSWRRSLKAWQRMEKHAVDLMTGRADQT